MFLYFSIEYVYDEMEDYGSYDNNTKRWSGMIGRVIRKVKYQVNSIPSPQFLSALINNIHLLHIGTQSNPDDFLAYCYGDPTIN